MGGWWEMQLRCTKGWGEACGLRGRTGEEGTVFRNGEEVWPWRRMGRYGRGGAERNETVPGTCVSGDQVGGPRRIME